MIRTEVQLPGESEAAVAAAIPGGAELVAVAHPSVRSRADAWSLPEPLPLGTFLAPADSRPELADSRES